MTEFDETVTSDDVEAFDFKHLKLSFDDDGVAWVTIDRPKQLNALNSEVVEELRIAVSDLTDDPETEAIVITGSGDKAFVAGADISELAELAPHEARGLSLNGQDVLASIENCPKPVIAMINGFALGGGLELALACHLRVASTTAKMGLPEVSLGVIPGFGGSVRLARLAGPGVAREWILTGDMFTAEEAHRVGAVTRVVPPEKLREEVKKLCSTMQKRGPVAIAAALETIRRGQECGQTEAENLEADAFGMMFSTEDAREGTKAFLEKRKPDFQGR
jgi:enoyl-CoA hydratase